MMNKKNTNTDHVGTPPMPPMEANNDMDAAYALMAQMGRSTIAVIDAIVQRGGFRGEELSTIGGLRDQCIQAIAMSEAYEQKD